jgi:D-alanyl-lipoteichoic acid acyltransferase DltB (MBOAT superfamily)
MLLFHWAVALWLDSPLGQTHMLKKHVFFSAIPLEGFAIALSIATLAYFKYTDIILPLGISFYTFNFMHFHVTFLLMRRPALTHPKFRRMILKLRG